ncbi:MAG: helix-turn-helix domain-containing protein [Nitrospirota bacterium]
MRDEVAQRIRKYRKKAGLTQEALAEKIGCSKTRIALLEQGKRGSKQRLLYSQIAEVLGIPVYTLFRDEDEAEKLLLEPYKYIRKKLKESSIPPEFQEELSREMFNFVRWKLNDIITKVKEDKKTRKKKRGGKQRW